jgi:hypothetical protein
LHRATPARDREWCDHLDAGPNLVSIGPVLSEFPARARLDDHLSE